MESHYARPMSFEIGLAGLRARRIRQMGDGIMAGQDEKRTDASCVKAIEKVNVITHLAIIDGACRGLADS